MYKLYLCIALLLGIILASSCSNHSTENANESTDSVKIKTAKRYLIDSLEKKMYSARTASMDMATASFAMRSYDDYATTFPNDSISANYLFKAGELANSMQYAQPALNYFKRLNKRYPTYENTSYSLLMQGIIYQDLLNDTANARLMYATVMKQFAGLQVAKDAEASIKNLGKTPEQLIKEFEAKNAAETKIK